VASFVATPVAAQEAAPAQVKMTAAELFGFADRARDAGDYAGAETAYRALIQDPDIELRTEARFRLARMYARQMNRKREAAVLLRRILDDKPDAAPVRLELAQILAELGDFQGARRELRAAEAGGGLPPEVEQRVRFYASALNSYKPIGGSIDVALAPSTNINRATASDTLSTVIGDFTLSDDAKAKSGIGLALKGQTYARLPLSAKADILLRANGSADVYRHSEFDDFNLSLQGGPQWLSGGDRLAIALAANWRWYGLDPYSVSYGLTGNFQHPMGKRSQLRVDATALNELNHANRLQDGARLTLAVGLDHALSARTGGGGQLYATREAARDPGYATASGGASAYLYREIARTTAVVNVSYRHLEADARLLLYPRRRIDDNLGLALSGTFRSLTVGTFAPVVRLRYERNWSTVGIYDFDRFGAEVGVTAAF
jgi:hypothetical protein